MPANKPRRVKPRRAFSKEFKFQVLHEIEAGTSLAEAARIHDVHTETPVRGARWNGKTGSDRLPGTPARTRMKLASRSSKERSGS